MDCIDHHRCRFLLRSDDTLLSGAHILDLIQRVASRYRWIHIEKTQEFDSEQGFTKAQGEDCSKANALQPRSQAHKDLPKRKGRIE